jgi:hypothetical protein
MDITNNDNSCRLSLVACRLSLCCILLSQCTFGYSESNRQNPITNLIGKLWGNNPPNNLQIGTLFYHVDHPNLPAIMARPYLGLTYNSVNFLFTKNCYYDNVFALTLQRELFSFQKDKNLITFGYRVGGLYGWCYKNGNFYCASHCGDTLPIIPAAQAVINYFYKNTGIEIASTGGITNLNFIYRFS